MFSVKDDIDEIIKYVDLPQIFEFYRIIDPFTNTTYNLNNGQLVPIFKKCCEIWNRDKSCPNCISEHAIKDKRSIIKLETISNSTFLILAVPISCDGKNCAIELISDVSDSLSLYTLFKEENSSDVSSTINKLNYMATHDGCTGFYNKTRAELIIERAISNIDKIKGPITAAITDIDNFKSVNDNYGYSIGDKVIKETAEIIRKTVPDTIKCKASRIGCDRFMLLFYNCYCDEVEEIMNNISRNIEKHMFNKDGEEFSVTISVGIKQFQKDDDNKDNFMDHVTCVLNDGRKRENKK